MFFEIMSKDDSHSNSFNQSSIIGSTTRISILFLEDYEVWVLHFKDYITGTETHGSRISQSIIEGPHQYA